MLLMWAASAFLIRILDLVSVLPMPSDCRFRAAKFEHVCSYFPWCLAASLPVQLLALLMTPYLPYLPNITYSSFLDVACIHQTDHELMERGVYGLGAFLKRSKELRIL
ncbi:Uncharacterized protein SCF082_LOCUS18652, partial [Durusdinium trenchii]